MYTVLAIGFLNVNSPLLFFIPFKKQRPNSLLSSVSGLGVGVGFLGNSVATADDLQTIIPPEFYQQTDDGQAVLATTDGQKVILGESQYLILEDGLLIITDELAQNTLNSLSVLGSFRSSDFTFPDAVSSSSGDIIETSSQQPVWSGDRPTFQSLGVETYELAQNNSKPEGSESSSNGTGIGNAGLGAGFGFGLMGLFFGSEKTEETPAATTSQETTPAPVTPDPGPARGFVINGIGASDNSGYSVSSAGDINNDGYDDIIIGAYLADPNGGSSGESYVVFGKASGTYSASLELSSLNGTNGFVINGIDANDYSGRSVSSAGDINNDGYDDIIIGARHADPNGDDAGESYVVFGKASGTYSASLELSSLNGTNGFVINGIDENDYSGRSVSSAGDINNDGYDDIIIGANEADPNGGSSGESYVVFGKASGTYSASLELSSLNGTNGFVINGIDENDYSGRSVSSAGDINNDGYDDIIIGAYPADRHWGESYVVFGKASGTYSASLELSSLNGTNGFVINGIDANDYSGYSVSSAGDINNDGYDDIIIGARFADPNGDDAGESYVVFGKASGTYSASLEPYFLNGTNGFVINGIDGYDNSGYSVSSAGDINNDGYDDIIIGARYADPNGALGSGESYVVFGKASGTYSASLELSSLNGTNGFVINGIDANDYSGNSVSSAGDINNDGYDDIIIGANEADPNGGNSGESYVVFGQSEFDASVNLSDLALME